MKIRTTLATLALALSGLVLPGAVFAQAGGGSTGGAGGGTTTTGPSAPPSHGNEIDMPIGLPTPGFEAPPPDTNEDDPPKLYDEELPTRTDSIIYVLDISGSMDSDSRSYTGLDGQTHYGTRLTRAKVELIKSIQALTREFEFNIIAYDCSTRQWSASKQKAEPGPKASATGWVNNLRAMGATGTGAAVARGLGDKSNFTVVLLSDGAPNCMASPETSAGHRAMIRAANTQGAVVHAFGIACYGSFEAFMRGVASDSGGRYVAVP
jgi:hypothetical protein